MPTRWEGLNPPYSTIVADPPWPIDQRPSVGRRNTVRDGQPNEMTFAPYSTMSLGDIEGLRAGHLAAPDSHLYLWTVARYLREAYAVAEAWGFRVSQVLTWAKAPRGFSPGGIFGSTTEFCLFCRRGSLAATDRPDSSWWNWPRLSHSVKPPAFYDLVERVSPGPYLELFARQPRLGWDSWGWGYEKTDRFGEPSHAH